MGSSGFLTCSVTVQEAKKENLRIMLLCLEMWILTVNGIPLFTLSGFAGNSEVSMQIWPLSSTLQSWNQHCFPQKIHYPIANAIKISSCWEYSWRISFHGSHMKLQMQYIVLHYAYIMFNTRIETSLEDKIEYSDFWSQTTRYHRHYLLANSRF